MSKKELLELLRLKGWTQSQLARELDLHRAAVCRWFSGEQHPTGPARILMRQWLDEAKRAQSSATPQS